MTYLIKYRNEYFRELVLEEWWDEENEVFQGQNHIITSFNMGDKHVERFDTYEEAEQRLQEILETVDYVDPDDIEIMEVNDENIHCWGLCQG